MKTIPILVQAELERSTARLAICMRIVRRDASIFCFTTNTKTLIIDGESYIPAASFNPSDVVSGSNLDTDDLQVEGLISSDTITEDDLRAGRWDYAAFEIFQVNWASPSDGKKKDRSGHLGKVTVTRHTFVVELLGEIEAYATSIGNITQPGCRTSLGTPECGIVPTVVTGTITTCADDFFTLTDDSRTEDDAFFDEGVITFLDGLAAGLSFEIKSYLNTGTIGSPPAGSLFITKTALPYDVTGASYSMSEGCSRRFLEDCVARFGNAANFRGEPWLRGTDIMVQVGRHHT